MGLQLPYFKSLSCYWIEKNLPWQTDDKSSNRIQSFECVTWFSWWGLSPGRKREGWSFSGSVGSGLMGREEKTMMVISGLAQHRLSASCWWDEQDTQYKKKEAFCFVLILESEGIDSCPNKEPSFQSIRLCPFTSNLYASFYTRPMLPIISIGQFAQGAMFIINLTKGTLRSPGQATHSS